MFAEMILCHGCAGELAERIGLVGRAQ